MPLEIERKFCVLDDTWRADTVKVHRLRQAYLMKNEHISIRVRIDGHEAATLTIKTPAPGIERNEYEYPIPVADAEELFAQRDGSIIAKSRYLVPFKGLLWEIDVFEGPNSGLVIAEVELEDVRQDFQRPAWLGHEITYDPRFYNAYLAKHPYLSWRTAEPRRSFGQNIRYRN